MPVDDVIASIRSHADASPETRRQIYNLAVRELRALVADLCDEPALSPQLAPAHLVQSNNYNPNRVASPEMVLLEESIRCDGVTMPIVTFPDGDRWVVIDGYHRRTVLAERMGRAYLPVTEIDRPIAERMASTIRHNRARGKHQVDLMASIVRSVSDAGWTDVQIAVALGMTVEEMLRLRQTLGAARMLAAEEYGEVYGRDDEPPEVP